MYLSLSYRTIKKKKIVADQLLPRTDVTDFQQLPWVTAVPGSPDCRNTSRPFHCLTYRLISKLPSRFHRSAVGSTCSTWGMYVIQSYWTVLSAMKSGEKLADITFQVKRNLTPFFFTTTATDKARRWTPGEANWLDSSDSKQEGVSNALSDSQQNFSYL